MSQSLPEINARIEVAQTLPGSFYQDEELYERSLDAVHARSWHWLGDASQFKANGAVALPQTLLPGALDEPVLLTREASRDKLRCLSAVCTHRGNLLSQQTADAKHIVCNYHGRRFDLQGRMLSMPEFEGAEDFPSAGDDLSSLGLGRLASMLFGSLRPAPAFEELTAEMRARIGFLPLEEFTPAPELDRDYEVNAHWALYVDNFLEGYHIPFVHPALSRALDYRNYRTELFRWSNLQVGIANDGEPVFELPADSPDAGQRIGGYYFWLFPTTMFNFYPWGLSLNAVQPLGPARTRVLFRTYVWKRELMEQGAGSGLDQVQREDEAVVEAVQIGTKSRLYTRGRYSPTREQGVHQFHRLLCDYLRT